MSLNILLLFIIRNTFAIGDTCSDSSIYHVDWPTITMSADIPDFAYSIEFDQFNLEIVINVNLTYLGYSTNKDSNILGTTYVLDFESLSAHLLPLNKPGTCSNRVASDFNSVDPTQWFGYSHANPPIVGDIDFLAYPPSGTDWFIESIDCNTIHYEGFFSYKQLFDECRNYAGDRKYSLLSTDDKWINLTLTFYINIVSPLAVSLSGSGYYRIYQLLSAPFVIAISKTIFVLEPVGMRLFTMSVIAVYKQHSQHDFRLIVVTETAEYLKLNEAKLVTYPHNLAANQQIHFQVKAAENECLANKNYICSQIWELYADNVPCPPTVFSGLYGMQFTAICNDNATNNDTINTQRFSNCQLWLATFEKAIDLSTQLTWKDEICDATIYEIHFNAVSRYFMDAQYAKECADGHLFAVGEDRIYVETEVIIPSGAYNVFSASLINVWLCTTSPVIGEPFLDTSTGLGGCLSSGQIIDDDGPYHILSNYDEVMLYNFTRDDDDGTLAANVVRYSFIPPVSIRRDTLYIHAQLKLSFINDGVRRRLLVNENVDIHISDQYKHSVGFVGIDSTESKPYEHFKEIEEFKKENGFYDKKMNDENENIMQQLRNRNNNDFNRGQYISMGSHAFFILEIVTVVTVTLLLVNVCLLMFAQYHKWSLY